MRAVLALLVLVFGAATALFVFTAIRGSHAPAQNIDSGRYAVAAVQNSIGPKIPAIKVDWDSERSPTVARMNGAWGVSGQVCDASAPVTQNTVRFLPCYRYSALATYDRNRAAWTVTSQRLARL